MTVRNPDQINQDKATLRLPKDTKIVKLKSGKRVGVRKSPSNEYIFVCLICGKEKTDRKSFMIHVQYHNYPEVRCNICQKTFTKPSNLKRHIFTVHSNHPEKEIALQGLAARRDTIMSERDGGEMEFACGFCPLTFTKLNSLQLHQRLIHHLEEEVASDLDQDDDNSYLEEANSTKRRRIDDDSMNNFEDDEDIDQSNQNINAFIQPGMQILVLKTGKRIGVRKTRQGQTVYVCLECGKEDSRRKALVNHVWYHNTKTVCKYCSQQFSTNNIKKHISTQHPGCDPNVTIDIKDEPESGGEEDFEGNPFEPVTEMNETEEGYNQTFDHGNGFLDDTGAMEDLPWEPQVEMSLTGE